MLNSHPIVVRTVMLAMIVNAVACRPSDGTSEIAQSAVTSVPVGPRPESITRAWGGKLYVSIQGPSGALGTFDGEIRQIDLTTGVTTTFVTGLENPRGLAFTGKFLIAADQQKIYRIDQAGQATVLAANTAFPFPAVFFNDAAPVAEDGSVYVTEMGRRDIIREPPDSPNAGHLIPVDSDAAFAVPATSRIYRINMIGKITNVFEPSRKLLVINGVTEATPGQGIHLLATDFFHGNIVDVDLDHGTKTILTTALRGADGLAQASDGTLFVSSFELGAVWRMDASGENLKVLIDHVGFQTTADFYLDEPAKKLYVPNTPAGTIMIVPTE
jgi:sugar lactone lactonase YvrE